MTRKGNPEAGGLTEDQINQIVDFLATAPKPVQPWAKKQAEHLENQLVDDDPDCLYEEFEDEDDILASRNRPKEDVRGDEPQKMPAGFKLVLAVVVIVGIVVGLWVAGQGKETNLEAGPPVQMGGGQMGGQTSMMGDPAADMALLVELEDAIAADPEDLDARLELGSLYFNGGLVVDAKTQWQAVLDIDPDNVMALYNMGFIYVTEDPPDYAAARELWEKVVELDPSSDLAEVALTHLDGLQGEND